MNNHMALRIQQQQQKIMLHKKKRMALFRRILVVRGAPSFRKCFSQNKCLICIVARVYPIRHMPYEALRHGLIDGPAMGLCRYISTIPSRSPLFPLRIIQKSYCSFCSPNNHIVPPPWFGEEIGVKTNRPRGCAILLCYVIRQRRKLYARRYHTPVYNGKIYIFPGRG